MNSLKSNVAHTIFRVRIQTSCSSSAEPDRLEITKLGFGGFFHFSNSAFFIARSRCLLSSSSIFCLRLDSCNTHRLHTYLMYVHVMRVAAATQPRLHVYTLSHCLKESLANAKVSTRQPWYIGCNSLNRPPFNRVAIST